MRRAGVTVAEGRIVDVGPAHPSSLGAFDYGDALLLPGAVDVHVHTRSYAEEGIERCTRAAAAGGVTTIVDMPYDAAGPVDSLAAFEAKVADVGREAVIDVALWATVPPRGPINEVGDLVDAGAAAFKLSTFETHPQRFPRIPDGQMLRAFAAIAQAGGLVGVHAENDEIVRAGIAAEQAAGRGGDPLAHARSRPPVAEHEAIARCPGAGAGYRGTATRLPRVDAARRRAGGGRPARRGRRERRDLPALPAPGRDRTCPPRRGGQDQPAAARGAAARRGARSHLV